MSKEVISTAVSTLSGVGAAAYLTNTVGAVAGLMGFGNGVVMGGSVAASMMSAAATSGIGGSAVAFLQSAGACFAAATGGGLVASTVAITAPVAAGYGIYKYLSS